MRLTCHRCGEVFTPDDEDMLVAMAVEHARKFHDINLLEQFEPDELRALVRRENEAYWARIAHLIPDGQVKLFSMRNCVIASESMMYFAFRQDRQRNMLTCPEAFPNRTTSHWMWRP